MDQLLLEIGTEEIPAGYIEPALRALSETLVKRLSDARIDHGKAKVYGTPMRLTVLVDGVADRQTAVSEEVVGPPETVGFDADGKPTVAALKFAEKVGVPASEIGVKETPKGRYLFAEKRTAAGATVEILPGILPEVIAGLPFPKTMKWADLGLFFARPIQSILALLGEAVIPFSMEGLQSDRFTRGHRFMAPDRIRIERPSDYLETLKSARVVADLDERRALIEADIERAAGEAGGRILEDPELIDIVKNLVEQPAAVVGRFDEIFLELPDEVLITAMREHQKYFAVVDDAGALMAAFVAVNNTRAKDMDLVAKGHERVLRARLADARFFFKSDLEIDAGDRLEKLKRVLFQADLGSMHDKVTRVASVAEFLAGAVDGGSALRDQAARAVVLCKTDLVSHVVVEFPKLQGIMGRVYAGIGGEDGEVAAAVEEHYRPTYSGGPLPETLTGAVVGIADKMDTICGCFSVGLIPTGASDPYALRRQAIGIVQIMLRRDFTVPLRALIEKSLAPFPAAEPEKLARTAGDVYTFFQNRMVGMLAEEGYAKDTIAAVTAVSVDNIPDVWNRVRALENLKAAPDFERLAVGFKRVVNIIRKSGQEGAAVVDEGRFEHESERRLWEAYRMVRDRVAADLEKGNFDQALMDIASLREPVDAFFDDVMVMAEDPALRENRLALLRHVASLFDDVADFSKMSA